VIATEICEKKIWSLTRAHGRGEETKLSSRGASIASELPSLNFNPLVIAEQSFVICYPNVVISLFAVAWTF